jgi:hypothetical protein
MDWTDGVRFPARERNCSIFHSVQTNPETHPVSYPMGTEDSLPGVKRHGHEVNHLPSSSAEVMNGGAVLHSPTLLYDVVLK